MKKRSYQIVFFTVLTICSFAFSNFLFAKVYEFDGTAKPFLTTTLPYGYNDDYRGIIKWTALPGDILKGPVYNKNGKVVRPGDILVKLDTKYRESVLKTKEDAIKIALANLEWTKAQFERYKTLSKNRATSLQEYQEAKNNYLNAIATLDSSKAELIQAQELYFLTTYRTQFDAIVDEVLMPCGLLAAEPLTIKISQIVPIAIEIEMPRELARKINLTTPIKVFPCGSDKPVGVITGYHTLTKKGIKIYADNYFLPPQNKGLPIVKKVRTVMRMNLTEKQHSQLSVNLNTIKKDDRGTFVWLVKDIKDMQPGKGVSPELELEKVYVKTGEYTYKISNHWLFIALQDPGKLKQYDLLVEDAPDNAKTGDMVYWSKEKLLFMPNDPVKVLMEINS